MKKPSPEEIRELVKKEAFQWYLERLAFRMNQIDTVRNINKDNLEEAWASRMAIEIIEQTLADIYQDGEIEKYQKKVVENEDNIVKALKDIDY
jgi:hypothetical protein